MRKSTYRVYAKTYATINSKAICLCNTQALDLWTRSILLHKRAFTQLPKRTNLGFLKTQAIVIISFPKFLGLGLRTPKHTIG